MKKTALYNKHIELGAKMVPFAGYDMPVQYNGVNAEHANVRNNVGIFDVSHMGEFIVSGKNALALIQKVSSNDASVLFSGRAQYAYLPNENGGVVDDLLIYMISENKYMLVVNASNIEKDWNWINKHNDVGATIENISDQMSLLAVQGPRAIDILQKLTESDLSSIKFYHFIQGKIGGLDNVIISATGYTGSGGFELYVNNKDAEKLWEEIFASGKEYGLLPAGLAARDTLRLEMGYCLYGNDINDNTSPISAGLGWVTKFNKPFINDEQLKDQKENGVGDKLVAFKLLDRGIPRKDYEIVDENNNKIGIVTSGTMGPSVKFSIGLGYVNVNYSKVGSKIYLSIRNKSIAAQVVKLPFYKSNE
jgi:aminomethyltransferase